MGLGCDWARDVIGSMSVVDLDWRSGRGHFDMAAAGLEEPSLRSAAHALLSEGLSALRSKEQREEFSDSLLLSS